MRALAVPFGGFEGLTRPAAAVTAAFEATSAWASNLVARPIALPRRGFCVMAATAAAAAPRWRAPGSLRRVFFALTATEILRLSSSNDVSIIASIAANMAARWSTPFPVVLFEGSVVACSPPPPPSTSPPLLPRLGCAIVEEPASLLSNIALRARSFLPGLSNWAARSSNVLVTFGGGRACALPRCPASTPAPLLPRRG